jgi:myo-inositol 2-dehydrogenase / D-chiro-inositol 1-dehydrogenase
VAQRGYAPALALARGVRLAGAADSRPERCARVAPGVPGHASARELLLAESVDALILATPASAHLADAGLAAQRGIAVLVEKPPAVDESQARALARLDPAPWIAFNRRFDPQVRRIRDSLPREGRVELSLRLDYARALWRPHAVRDDALLDLGCHLVDLVRWITGRELRAARAIRLSDRAAEFEVGVEDGIARIRCATNRATRETIAVRTEGRPVARVERGSLAQRARARLARRGPNAWVTSLALQLEAFARAARGATAGSLATAADGLAAMTAIDAVRSSTRRDGAWVELEPG